MTNEYNEMCQKTVGGIDDSMEIDDWIYLNDIQAVAIAQSEGWEIEVEIGEMRAPWQGDMWRSGYKFRGRPRQPKMKEVKMECWLIDGVLQWRDEKLSIIGNWIHQPHLDMIAKVPE